MTDPLRLSRDVVACNYAAGLRFLRPPEQVSYTAAPVALEPDAPAEAGRWGTWTLTCTLPDEGLSPTGALRCYVGNPLGASPSFQRLQGEDPAGEGFVTAWAGSRRLRVETDLTGPGGLPLGNVVQVRADGEPVPGGVEVRLVLGDRAQGGPGARLPHYDGYVGFWLSLDAAGDGRWVDWADVPVLRVRSGPLATLRLVVPSLAVAGRKFRAVLQGFDVLGNPAPLEGTFVVSEAGRPLRRVVVSEGASGLPPPAFSLALEEVGVHRLQVRGEGLSGEGNPVEVLARTPAWGLFWGEIHGHSWLSDGTADPEAYFRYGRDVACLDFCALTDHDTWLTPEKWAIIRHVVQAHHRPREFVTILGFEWSSGQFWTPPGRRFGHKNVYYVGETGPFFSHLDPRYDTPAKLWAALDPAQCITIAHHPAYPRDEFPCWGTDWSHHHEALQPLVEVYSKHGLSEGPAGPFPLVKEDPAGYVAQALARGYHLGFVAGSDTHLSRPGSLQVEHRRGARYPWSGLTAVYARDLTRVALFEALRARRTYATTGARMVVDFRVNGTCMGGVVRGDAPRRLRVRVRGTARLARVDIVRNNRLWVSVQADGPDWQGEWTDADGPGACAGEGMPPGLLFYYLRVTQEDGHMAWSSPVWVEGADAG